MISFVPLDKKDANFWIKKSEEPSIFYPVINEKGLVLKGGDLENFEKIVKRFLSELQEAEIFLEKLFAKK
jgi:hypothetical protein